MRRTAARNPEQPASSTLGVEAAGRDVRLSPVVDQDQRNDTHEVEEPDPQNKGDTQPPLESSYFNDLRGTARKPRVGGFRDAVPNQRKPNMFWGASVSPDFASWLLFSRLLVVEVFVIIESRRI